jgi:hypothetical protein
MSITYYKCVPVALATQQAKHMSNILSSVACLCVCLSVLCFSTLADKRRGLMSQVYV